jgi:hypothetical protein
MAYGWYHERRNQRNVIIPTKRALSHGNLHLTASKSSHIVR